MPTTFKGIPSDDAFARYKAAPITSEFLLAKAFPTMHSAAPSENQLPSMMCHQGFVCGSPVTNFPPSGRLTSCAAQEPIKSASPACEDSTNAAEAGENCGVEDATLVSTIGAKAMMLLCQKMVLIL